MSFAVAEAVMRKRNELEKMKMMRQDEERRREELVGGITYLQKTGLAGWKNPQKDCLRTRKPTIQPLC